MEPLPSRMPLLAARAFACLAAACCALAAEAAFAQRVFDLPRALPIANAEPQATLDGAILPADPDGEAILPLPAGGQPAEEDLWFDLDVPPMGDAPELFIEPQFGPEAEEGLWSWELLPDGLLYPSYLAGPRESRFGSQWVWEQDHGWLWDVTLGGRFGLLRYGAIEQGRPRGWQLDLEGAAFPRLDLERNADLVSSDFRFGIPLTYSTGRWQAKAAYYHYSAHVGDEFLLANPGFVRINYSRDALVWGLAYKPVPAVRLYGELGYAFARDGGAEPWELQTGVEFSPAPATGLRGAPFLAVNGHLREEVDWGGSLTAQAGWQWRGRRSSHLLRTGVQYFNGKSESRAFYRNFEQQLGVGVWYDY